MKKTGIALLLILTLLLTTACSFPGASSGQKRYEAEFLNLFDTFTKIVGYSDDEKV